MLHQDAERARSQREPLEGVIEGLREKGDEGREKLLAMWQRYIDLEQRLGDPPRQQLAYERALVDCFWSQALWEAYVEWVDGLGSPGVALPVHVRATRNCLRAGALWVKRLRAMERAGKTVADLRSVYDRARLLPLYSAEDYLNVRPGLDMRGEGVSVVCVGVCLVASRPPPSPLAAVVCVRGRSSM